MVIYLRWTSCQPEFCSLSGSSDKEEFGSEDIFESDGQLSGRSEPADSIRISELEAFEKLREKNWKCSLTFLQRNYFKTSIFSASAFKMPQS